MNLTRDDINNILVFLKRTPCEGLVEATIMAALGAKLRAILGAANGQDIPAAAE